MMPPMSTVAPEAFSLTMVPLWPDPEVEMLCFTGFGSHLVIVALVAFSYPPCFWKYSFVLSLMRPLTVKNGDIELFMRVLYSSPSRMDAIFSCSPFMTHCGDSL